jgi:hypothetical protein
MWFAFGKVYEYWTAVSLEYDWVVVLIFEVNAIVACSHLILRKPTFYSPPLLSRLSRLVAVHVPIDSASYS